MPAKSKPKRKVGRPQLTNEGIIAAIHKYKGRIYRAAKSLGIATTTIYRHMEACPEIKQAIKEERGQFLDLVEDKLMERIKKGDPASIFFVLRTQGRNRGYVERKEVRVGGDDKAPPIQTQSMVLQVNPDLLPLELRKQLLQQLREQKARQIELNSSVNPIITGEESVSEEEG